MNAQRILIALLAVNLVVMGAVLARFAPVEADAIPALVQARSFELVDANGVVRHSLKVEESGVVVFRLMSQEGEIRVKLGADNDGSGFVLLDDATEVGIHLLAQTGGPTVTLRGKDGQERTMTSERRGPTRP